MVCVYCKGTGIADPAFVGAGLCRSCLGSGLSQPVTVDAVAEQHVGDVNSDAKGSGARYNAGKPPWELLPVRVVVDLLERDEPATPEREPVYAAMRNLGRFQARIGSDSANLSNVMAETADAADMTMQELLSEAAHVLEYGRRKYASWNWSKGMPWSVPIGCSQRHLLKMLAYPQSHDDESGRLHAGHVAANILMLLTFSETYPEGDDRPTTLKEQP